MGGHTAPSSVPVLYTLPRPWAFLKYCPLAEAQSSRHAFNVSESHIWSMLFQDSLVGDTAVLCKIPAPCPCGFGTPGHGIHSCSELRSTVRARNHVLSEKRRLRRSLRHQSNSTLLSADALFLLHQRPLQVTALSPFCIAIAMFTRASILRCHFCVLILRPCPCMARIGRQKVARCPQFAC